MNGSTHEEILKEDQEKTQVFIHVNKVPGPKPQFQRDKNQKFQNVKGEDWNKRSFCRREPELMEVQQRWCLSHRCITVHRTEVV